MVITTPVQGMLIHKLCNFHLKEFKFNLLNFFSLRDFVFWHVPQIQYKNPSVQVVTFKNMTPSPFVRCYYDDGKEMLIDIDSRHRDEILSHLIKVIGKSA